MANIVQYNKVCEYCESPFIAQKRSTKYCSHKCASRAYKANERKYKIQHEEARIKKEESEKEFKKLQLKPMLTVTQTAKLIGVSRTSIYKYLEHEELTAIKLGHQTFIRLEEILEKFNTSKVNFIKHHTEDEPILEVYTYQEIWEKYKVSYSWMYQIVKRNKIPVTFEKGKNLYSKKHIDKYFAKKNKNDAITEWVTAPELAKEYNLTKSSVYRFISERNIPKKREQNLTYSSKIHFDLAKKDMEPSNEDYYSSEEIMEKYKINRGALDGYLGRYKIPRIKVGQRVKISKVHFDKIFENRKQ